MTFLLLITAGCGKAESEADAVPSTPTPAAEEAPQKTVADAEALIGECRFDEAYELLLTLAGDPEADALLECYIEFPDITMEFPEEDIGNELFEVKEYYLQNDASSGVLDSVLFNLSPYFDFEEEEIQDFWIYYEKGRISRFWAQINSLHSALTIDYEYSEDGKLLKTTLKRSSQGTNRPLTWQDVTEYDEEQRPIRVFSDNETVLYTYEGGLLREKQVQDNYHAYHYEYFYENGLLKSVKNNGMLDTSYEYDENGRLLKVEIKSNAAESKTVVYETDENGKETRTERFGNGNLRKYDENGNLTYYEGLTEGYGNLAYDENGRLISAEWSVNYTKKTVEFTYDEKGHMASATVTKNGRTIVYTFTEYKAYYIPDANIRNALYKELYFGAKRVG